MQPVQDAELVQPAGLARENLRHLGREEPRVILVVLLFAGGALLLFLSGIARYTGYGLDENVYVNSARALIDNSGQWTPDHPPLGKSLLAIGIKIAGDNALGWRVAAAMAGSLTLVAVMLMAYLFVGSLEYTVAAGLLTIFNNFLFVMSRVATLDTFLMLYLFWGYLLFCAAIGTSYPATKRNLCLILSGILLGLAAAVKWNGLFSIAGLVLIGAIAYLRERNFSLRWMLASFSLLAPSAYCLTFSPLFRSRGESFTFGNLVRAQTEMFVYMRSLPGNIFIHVPWYRWPFQIEPQRGIDYLVGNYAVTFGGLLALGFCLWRVVRRFALAEFTIVALYATSLLQWLAIPRKVTYYYYYYPCVLLLGLAITLALARWQRKTLLGVRLVLIPVLAAFMMFLFCYPHMAGLQAPWDTIFGYWR